MKFQVALFSNTRFGLSRDGAAFSAVSNEYRVLLNTSTVWEAHFHKRS